MSLGPLGQVEEGPRVRVHGKGTRSRRVVTYERSQILSVSSYPAYAFIVVRSPWTSPEAMVA